MKKQIVATSRERGDVCDLKRSGGAQREFLDGFGKYTLLPK